MAERYVFPAIVGTVSNGNNVCSHSSEMQIKCAISIPVSFYGSPLFVLKEQISTIVSMGLHFRNIHVINMFKCPSRVNVSNICKLNFRTERRNDCLD